MQLSLASGLAVLVLVLGGVLVLFGYADLSVCLSLRYIGSSNCWDPFNEPSAGDPFHNFAESVIIFYIGIIVAISGAVLLMGGDVVRLLGRLKGAGHDPQ